MLVERWAVLRQVSEAFSDGAGMADVTGLVLPTGIDDLVHEGQISNKARTLFAHANKRGSGVIESYILRWKLLAAFFDLINNHGEYFQVMGTTHNNHVYLSVYSTIGADEEMVEELLADILERKYNFSLDQRSKFLGYQDIMSLWCFLGVVMEKRIPPILQQTNVTKKTLYVFRVHHLWLVAGNPSIQSIEQHLPGFTSVYQLMCLPQHAASLIRTMRQFSKWTLSPLPDFANKDFFDDNRVKRRRLSSTAIVRLATVSVIAQPPIVSVEKDDVESISEFLERANKELEAEEKEYYQQLEQTENSPEEQKLEAVTPLDLGQVYDMSDQQLHFDLETILSVPPPSPLTSIISESAPMEDVQKIGIPKNTVVFNEALLKSCARLQRLDPNLTVYPLEEQIYIIKRFLEHVSEFPDYKCNT